MKWFQHECMAKYDLRLRALGEECGAEGIGIYWMLLEELGQNSETFHLKIAGVSPESDRAFAEAIRGDGGTAASGSCPVDGCVPRIQLKSLAVLLHTTERKLLRAIQTSVEAGLFHEGKWLAYGLLYSAAFERRADNYTRRRRRSEESVRTMSEYGSTRSEYDAQPVPSHDAATQQHVHPEEIQKQKETEKQSKNQNEISEREIKLCSVPTGFNLSTGHPHPAQNAHEDEAVLVPSAGYFMDVCTEFREAIREWNQLERSSINWVPSHGEMKKLFYGGDRRHKLWLCRQAAGFTGGRPDFPAVVLRALGLLLEASTNRRIDNPFGWVWSCIHGTPEGMPPWVHLRTAAEEAGRTGPTRSPPC